MVISTYIYLIICKCSTFYTKINKYYFYRDIVRFSFGYLLQKQLDQFVNEWNHHRIRPTKMAHDPAGVPNVMYPAHKYMVIEIMKHCLIVYSMQRVYPIMNT